MRFETIRMLNYRQHRDLKLEFKKKSSSDLHIFIAENGVGKTTLLNAICWCLYGDEPHLSGKSKTLPIANTAAIREANSIGQDAVKVDVEIESSVGTKRYVISRSASCRILNDSITDTPSSQLTVKVFDSTSAEDTQYFTEIEASNEINKYLPESIREYFFFDGEQLDSYLVEGTSTKIKSAIHGISQVDVLTRTALHLQEFIKVKESEAGTRSPNISSAQKDAEQFSVRLQELKDCIEDRKQKIDHANHKIEKISSELVGYEKVPELSNQWGMLKEDKKQLEVDKRTREFELMQYLRTAKVALSFTPVARSVKSKIETKRQAKQLPPRVDKELLKEMLEESRCSICDKQLDGTAYRHINKLIADIDYSSETSHALVGIESSLDRVVESASKYKKESKRMIEQIVSIDTKIETIEQDMAFIDREIGTLSNASKEDVILLHEEKKQLLGEVEHLREQNALDNSKIPLTEDMLNNANNKLAKLIAQEQSLTQIQKELNFLRKCLDIVKLVEQEMMDEVRLTMQKSTTDNFARFIWKKDVYRQVVLDEKYQVELIHKDGYSCLGSCSAGERALLAMAFTLALHEVSGFAAPIIIDTPLARISRKNRKNFAEMFSSVGRDKQVIMTLTPDEYSKEVSDSFDTCAATKGVFDLPDGEHSRFEGSKQ